MRNCAGIDASVKRAHQFGEQAGVRGDFRYLKRAPACVCLHG